MLLVQTFLKPSPIEGIGCFAAHFIPAGTPVWRFVPCFDVMLPPSFCAEMCNAEFLEKYAQQCPLTGYYVLCADDARFMNHSDSPNVGAVAPLFDPRNTHDAVRDIAAGEEMTCDYRVGDVAPFYGFQTREMTNGKIDGAAQKRATKGRLRAAKQTSLPARYQEPSTQRSIKSGAERIAEPAGRDQAQG